MDDLRAGKGRGRGENIGAAWMEARWCPCWMRNCRDARIWIVRNQFDRRNLTPAQRMDLALLLKSDIQARVQERKKATEGRPKKDTEKPRENFPEVTAEDCRTNNQVAKLAGISGRTLDKYEKVKETAAPY